MPIYLNGSLQYFADVRAANNRIELFFQKFDDSINERIAACASRRSVAEGGSSSGGRPPTPPQAGAAAAFNSDAEGVQR